LNEHISAGEEKFERIRQRSGLYIAPLIFLVLWFVSLNGLSTEAHRLLAIIGLVVSLWLTEAIPLAATALLGPALAVVVGIAPVKEVFKSFADPIIFLFLGSFLLAEAMMTHGLNRRVAFSILGIKTVSGSPGRLLLAFAAITGLISMWVSNTATTAMMFPIAMAILKEIASQRSHDLGRPVGIHDLAFGTRLMLITAFAASVGGYGTPVGTPPNLIGLGMINKSLNVQITFFEWMAFCVPLTICLLTFLVLYLNPKREQRLGGNIDEWLDVEKTRLGSLTRGEWNVIIAFAMTVLLWIVPGLVGVISGTNGKAFQWLNMHFPESIVSLLGALLLFVLPIKLRDARFTLSWQEAARIDWGTILLFGGGLALGELMFTTGLASWLGNGLATAVHAKTTFGVTALFAAVAIVISEATSNTASATMTVPVAIAVAQAAGVNPVQAALAATLGSSMGFMLPVSTPPNAIVYGSGCVPLLKMVRYGVLLDVAGWVMIVVVVNWLVPLVLKSQPL
jgi:solute carrier family 13 (sodium-dependent dicarboxylate transporter), member 2/3/5